MFYSSSFNYTQLSQSNMNYMHGGVFFVVVCLVFVFANMYQGTYYPPLARNGECVYFVLEDVFVSLEDIFFSWERIIYFFNSKTKARF